MLLRKRHLLIGLAMCAVLHVASVRARRMAPAQPDIPIATVGSFERDGQYPGEEFAHASVRLWGSWSGSDDNAGTITLGPFPAPNILRLALGGYPDREGNSLIVELADHSAAMPLKPPAVGERWSIVEFSLPEAWRKRPIRIVGRDNTSGIGGWFAISEPIRGGRSDGNNALLETLAAFAINGLLLGVIYGAAATWLSGVARIPRGEENRVRVRDVATTPQPHERSGLLLAPHWIPLGAGAVVAACGYLAFWAYFANALFGLILSWSLIAASAVFVLWPRGGGGKGSRGRARTGGRGATKGEGKDGGSRGDEGRGRGTRGDEDGRGAAEVGTVVKLMIIVGAFYLGLLHLFPTSHDFYTLAANRHREALPSDNLLPHTMAERLFRSEPLKNPVDEWLSSDRPPLQTGWQLLTWPAAKRLNLERQTASGTAAVWFQLLWIAGAYGLLRSFGIERRRAAGWIAALALCGFFLQNTTYTWPKLASAAFGSGAAGILLLPPAGFSTRRNARWCAGFAGLAWLAHGGIAFSLLALMPVLIWRVLRTGWRAWTPAATALTMLVAPWLAYQTFYDPPGNRLVKWHIAGQPEKDTRGTWETLRDKYAKIGWREAWSNKVSNFHAQVYGDWDHLIDFSRDTAGDRRHEEFFYPARALTWWPVLSVFALVITRRRVFVPPRVFAVFAGWLLLTIVIWCLLMFGQYQAVIHHGSYALMIGLFVLFSVVLERCGRGWLALIVILQSITLTTTWVIGNTTIHGPADGLYFVLVSATGLAWFLLRAYVPSVRALALPPFVEDVREVHGARTPAGVPHDAGAAAFHESGWRRIGSSLRAWWANPRLTFWVIAALTLLLFLRKPHALHTPQLWAEDGSIFLMQSDLHGPAALLMPYMGYLHTLPRLVAWVAPILLDPAWWPALYNGFSFAVWLAVLARIFTSRLELPGKPWLALAMIAVPHTGEIFFNITNLQWLTALVLLQQVLIRPPGSNFERVTDLAILGLVTLTGPFGIIFLPLFAWRWWRDRRFDNVLALAVVLLCGALQAWFVIQTGPRFEFQSEPFQLGAILVVLARRLIMWPVFGYDVAIAMSPGVVAAIGGTFMFGLIAWSLRPHPRRMLRARIVAALLLIVLAAVYRTRPDTWAADNLDYGDRYFYIPRVLLAWLLIWEFDAVPRIAAKVARVFCAAVLLTHLREYTLRAPPDYHWAEQVEPIRKGVPADLQTLPEGWMMEYRGRPERKP